MNFNRHSDLQGLHAFLGASKYHWINYDEERLAEAYLKYLAIQKGTELHEFAATCIRLGQKLPRSQKSLNNYINDAIGYKMTPEQPLYYSDNSFGTADSISFRDKILRIHDLKTGVSATSMHQLEVYAALFCLEYDENPTEIDIELRIYQSHDVVVLVPFAEDIQKIMEKIIAFDKFLDKLKSEE